MRLRRVPTPPCSRVSLPTSLWPQTQGALGVRCEARPARASDDRLADASPRNQRGSCRAFGIVNSVKVVPARGVNSGLRRGSGKIRGRPAMVGIIRRLAIAGAAAFVAVAFVTVVSPGVR